METTSPTTLRRIEVNESIDPQTHGLIEVVDATGDTKLIWDRNNADEVTEARRTFDNLRQKGHAAWSVNPKTSSKEKQITEFDPGAESLILVPQIQGG